LGGKKGSQNLEKNKHGGEEIRDQVHPETRRLGQSDGRPTGEVEQLPERRNPKRNVLQSIGGKVPRGQAHPSVTRPSGLRHHCQIYWWGNLRPCEGVKRMYGVAKKLSPDSVTGEPCRGGKQPKGGLVGYTSWGDLLWRPSPWPRGTRPTSMCDQSRGSGTRLDGGGAQYVSQPGGRDPGKKECCRSATMLRRP